MKSVSAIKFWLCLLLATSAGAEVATFDFKPVKLSVDQRASLQRFLTTSLPELTFDWNSLTAQSQSIGGKRQPLSVSLSTVPALTVGGVCRSEQHHFYVDAATGRWQANEELKSFYASRDCTAASSPISVGKSLSDADFLFIERGTPALRSKAAGVVGGSDCARVRFCEVTLRRINRVRQESPERILTKLTFSPVKPGPDCLYVMEVSFVGPLKDLVPLSASCPLP